MSYFRDYLRAENALPDEGYLEPDESWFVFELLIARLGMFPPRAGMIPPGRQLDRPWRFRWWARQPYWPAFLYIPGITTRNPDPLSELSMGPETVGALRFVSTFLCFFMPKPPQYRQEVSAFKHFFIPRFSVDRDKRILLLNSLLPTFWQLSLGEVAKEWYFEDMSKFIKPDTRFRWQGGPR